MQTGNTSGYNCHLCNEHDGVDTMVACDVCNNWHHFKCVGVDHTVKDRRWVCQKCEAGTYSGLLNLPHTKDKTAKSGGSKTSKSRSKKPEKTVGSRVSITSSARAAALEAQMRLLEEEELLKEKELKDQEEFQRREFAEEQRKLEMKKKLMEEESKLREAELSKQKDLQEKMMLLKRESMEKKKELMRQQAELSESSVASHVSKSGRVRDWITSQQQFQGDNTENIQQRIPYPTPHIANEASLERDGSLLAARQLSNLSLHDDDRHTTKPEIPTAYMQIAARQVTGRDLPAFSGNPEDWPMFIRTYEETTAACGFSDVENLVRLQKCLRGNALETVRSRLMMPAGVSHVIKTLQMRFGRPELIIRSLLERIRRVAAPKPERLDTLIDFGLAVENLVVHLQAAKQENHLTNPVLLQELVAKLPAQLRLDWARYKILQQDATLATFGDFMNELIQAASEVSFDLPVSLSARAEKPKDREKVFIHTHDAPDMESKASGAIKKTQKPCIVCSAIGHRVAECEEFKAKCVDDRMQIVRQHNLCRTCLNFHQKWPCRTWHGCNIEGCRERHHFLLHPTTTSHFSSNHSTIISASSDSYPYFRILPVFVSMGNKRQVIYAFIDEGSSSTLLDQSVAEQLGLDGPTQPLTLQWTANVERQESRSKKVNFQISGTGKADTFQITAAHTVERLLLPKQSLPYGALTNKYPHLRGLPIADYAYAEPKILIGLDNLSLCVPLKVREGRMNDPIAAKCRLGWTIYGYSACASGPTVSVNFHVAAAPDADHELNEQLKDFVSLDRSLTTPAFEMPESDADRRARMLLEETTRKVSGRFETGLLWKSDNIEFPNSLPMAIRRLELLEKKLDKDLPLRQRVHQKMEEYLAKGYCHRISSEELNASDNKRVWYLPLCVVVNPKKPNKVRVVWDAAAKVNGVSFNSALLKGPDMLTCIVSVLYHFREHKIAITGDIEEMFLRLLIRPQDSQCQRFLWREHPGDTPSVYVIDVATFGSTCSPCSAQFVKNTNAREYMEKFPRASTAIIKYHYVDDYLDSFNTVEEAIAVVQQVKMIHSKGGFNLRNFLSNSNDVLTAINGNSDETANDNKQLSLVRAEKVESVLGMKWSPSKDVFVYTVLLRDDLVKVVDSAHIPTKREMLKLVMSLFDPLGFAAFFLIHGRVIIQDVWATGIGWDEPVNCNLYERWCEWIGFLPLLNELQIPRSYFRGIVDEAKQLHVFVDASDTAYACVAYMRASGSVGVELALVGAKSKVAPLKVLSVPRLELMAAVIGARMADSILSSHSLNIADIYMWSDSSTVLAWINSDHRRYNKFVGVRIGEILALTKMNQWQWLPSKQNPADEATKWGKGPSFNINDRWFCGPTFLYQPEAEWPRNQKLMSTEEESVSALNVHCATTTSLIDFSRFQKWERLLRTQAYVSRFINNSKCRRNGQATEVGALKQEELKHAEQHLWKQVQNECYDQERNLLLETQGSPNARHNIVQKSSTIYKLWPYIDQHGIMRMRGRIGAAWYATDEVKYPVVLPKAHLVTSLLVDSYHRRYHHANHETVVNEIRQLFEISNLRTLVKQVARRCAKCRIANAVPRPPPMAPLPEQRITPHVRPFTFVGLDYFGPLTVKVGRSEVKRWVALFTCLTVRAIHLEVVHSLSSESCVMAIRRFIARRGAPAEIFSDNGTSFVGANKQLQQEIAARDQILASTFTNTNTRWNFNPPSAPHMGGVWERLVRSVKSAIGTVIDSPRRPNDEALQTILFDAEAMINSRPLTYVPLETADEESLTPNHFLLGNSSGVKQPPSKIDNRPNLRSSWTLVQNITDAFWKRWIKEYLPVITRRCRWFEDVRDVEEGDLVLIVGTTTRNQYIRGRVEKVFYGRDGRVRQALVRTSNGVYRRPVVKLALLDVGLPSKGDQDS